MTVIGINEGLSRKQMDWLIQNLGPILYYLHDKVGGQKWEVRNGSKDGWRDIMFVDDQDAIMFSLCCL